MTGFHWRELVISVLFLVKNVVELVTNLEQRMFFSELSRYLGSLWKL